MSRNRKSDGNPNLLEIRDGGKMHCYMETIQATHDDPVPRKSNPAVLSGKLSQLEYVSFRQFSL